MKGRYSPIQLYISDFERCSPIYNDQNFTLNKSYKRTLQKSLKANGLEIVARDTRLMNHFAYQNIREHPVVFQKDLKRFSEQKDKDLHSPDTWIESLKIEDNPGIVENTNLFEAVQSTNWNNVRFKPAASYKSKNSWLVEFRPMDTPITSREKKYLVLFATLMQRIMTDPQLETNFYIPISKTDRNMSRAILRAAVTDQKFYFRRYFYGPESSDKRYQCSPGNKNLRRQKLEQFEKEMLVELTLEQLLEGGPGHQGFKGLIQLFIELNKEQLRRSSELQQVDLVAQIWEVYDFMLGRARGELLTSASLIRKFVGEHPLYKHDSVVEGELMEDLIRFLLEVQEKNNHPLLFSGS